MRLTGLGLTYLSWRQDTSTCRWAFCRMVNRSSWSLQLDVACQVVVCQEGGRALTGEGSYV